MKKNESGLPYFASEMGIMVYTSVTAEGLTYEMWLPVMDNLNNSLAQTPRVVKTKFGDKTIESATMFDVNKAIMRCLTKNLAMFGLGLYIYAGEDLPEVSTESIEEQIDKCTNVEELNSLFFIWQPKVAKNKRILEMFTNKKNELNKK